MRSCYQNYWRLFAGDEETETLGRYCFAPPGARHYSGLHNLGSRNWTWGEILEDPPLGEKRSTYQRWHNGLTPSPFPFARRIGSSACLSDGETTPAGELPGREWREGFDSRCYLLPAGPPNQGPWQPDIQARPDQIALAQVLKALYDDPATVETKLLAYMGGGAILESVPNTVFSDPGYIIGERFPWVVIAISGTTTPEQIALQVMYAAGGPTNFGLYATNTFWEQQAVKINGRLTPLGIDVAQPILFAGHSAGGAIGTLAAIRLHEFKNDRSVSVLSFGMPKPGDQKVADLHQLIRACHVSNVGDPVPQLPPDLDALAPFLGALPALFVGRWVSTLATGARLTLDANGHTVENADPPILQSIVETVAGEAVAGLPFDLFAAHAIAEYLARLQLGP